MYVLADRVRPAAHSPYLLGQVEREGPLGDQRRLVGASVGVWARWVQGSPPGPGLVTPLVARGSRA